MCVEKFHIFFLAATFFGEIAKPSVRFEFPKLTLSSKMQSAHNLSDVFLTIFITQRSFLTKNMHKFIHAFEQKTLNVEC